MCLGWGKGCSSKDNEEEVIPPRIEESQEPFFLALAKCDIFEVTNKKSRCLNPFPSGRYGQRRSDLEDPMEEAMEEANYLNKLI